MSHSSMDEFIENSPHEKISPFTVAIFGFSVSERSGYRSKLQDALMALNESCDVRASALGGASGKIIPYLIDRIPRGHAKHMIFEICTSARYFEKDANKYTSLLAEISHRCFRLGVFPCFLNLYRREYDHPRDLLSEKIAQFAQKFGFPFLDLIPAMHDLATSNRLDQFLWDGVHTTELGSSFYAAEVANFIRSIRVASPWWSDQQAEIMNLRPPKRSIINISDHQGFDMEEFGRAGLRIPCAVIPEQQSISVDLPERSIFDGIFYVMGPRSGKFNISFPELNRKLSHFAYDDTSYYQRFSYFMHRVPDSRSVVIHQDSELPAITLKKGIASTEARRGLLGGILVTRPR